jgi:hypothetical protein
MQLVEVLRIAGEFEKLPERGKRPLSEARPADMEEEFVHFMLKFRYVAGELVVDFVDLHAHGDVFGRGRAKVERHHTLGKLMPIPRRMFGDLKFITASMIVCSVIRHCRLRKSVTTR